MCREIRRVNGNIIQRDMTLRKISLVASAPGRGLLADTSVSRESEPAVGPYSAIRNLDPRALRGTPRTVQMVRRGRLLDDGGSSGSICRYLCRGCHRASASAGSVRVRRGAAGVMGCHCGGDCDCRNAVSTALVF